MKLNIRIAFGIFIFLAILEFNCNSQPETGLTHWAIRAESSGNAYLINWLKDPPEISDIPGTSPSEKTTNSCGVNQCGDLVFAVLHSGNSSNPNNLFIYKSDGTALLTNSTSNGPGLSGDQFDREIQVLQVPNQPLQWYIIYKKWTGSSYNPANIAFSKIEIMHDQLTVLIRDQLLEVNGNNFTYSHAKATSIDPANPDQLVFYCCRRSNGNNYLSIDQFYITENGIEFNKNSGDIYGSWWDKTCSGSLLEVTADGRRIAVSNRNDIVGFPDLFILSSETFSPSTTQTISLGELILQPDGNILTNPTAINQVYQNNIQLYFLSNFERKISYFEFSPNGQYLYLVHGGYPGGGVTYTTYLAQIDLGPINSPATYPYNIRMQIQRPPGNFNPNTGAGGQMSSYLDSWNALLDIQTAYDGKLYFTKRADNKLFVLSNPNDPLPISLSPREIDFSDALNPNIILSGSQIVPPDDINGYEYKIYDPLEVYLGNDTTLCQSYNLLLDPGNAFISYLWQDNSSQQLFNVNQSGLYWVETVDEHGCYSRDTIEINFHENIEFNLGNDTSICKGDSAQLTMPLTGLDFHWQDGSTDPVFIAWDEGWYWVEAIDGGCTGYDSIYLSFRENPQPNLGDSAFFCSGSDITLDPGTFVSYLWQDNSTTPTYTASKTGTYWVEVSDGFCLDSDSVILYERTNPLPYLGPDTTICNGSNVLLNPGSYETYLWNNNSTNNQLYASEEGPYWVIVSDGYCEGSDTVFVFLEDCSCRLHFPNCFTPNNDGINDTFYGKGYGIEDLDLFIFNRWGQEVFKGNGIEAHWDGKYKNQLCAQGVYYFVAFYKCIGDIGNEKSKTAKGSVTLLRD